MKIKDEFELAHILGMAFSQHANRVQNGATEPYKAFLQGQTVVTVNIQLNDDGSIGVSTHPLGVEPIPESKPIESAPPTEEIKPYITDTQDPEQNPDFQEEVR